MKFGNLAYIYYIISASAAVLAALVFYIIWRQSVLKRLAHGGGASNLVRFSVWRRRVGGLCLILSVILFAFVILRPQWGERTREVESGGADVLVALDVSRSMLAGDVGTSRLERSKNALRLVAGSLKGDRIGLIVFAGDAFLLCPLTSDIEAFMVFLDSADTNSVSVQGTNIAAVLNEALRIFEKKRFTEKILLLISDGEDHEGNILGVLGKLKQSGAVIYAAAVGRDKGDYIPLGGTADNEIYMSDKKGGFIKTAQDSEVLKKLAYETGGIFFDISNNFSGLKNVMDALSSAHKNYYGSRIVSEPVERYAFFLLPLIFLLSAELMLSEMPMAAKAALSPRANILGIIRKILGLNGERRD